MDQLAIQTIEDFLDVPLIAPAAINEIDSRAIAAALARLEGEVAMAREYAEDIRDQPEVYDETTHERAQEITELIQDVIKLCETCQAGQVCASHEAFKLWVAEA